MEYEAAAVAVGNVKGAMMNPCRSFRLTCVELTSLAGVLNVYLQVNKHMISREASRDNQQIEE